MWEKIHNPECPEWVEFHMAAVTPDGDGACLKVYFGYSGFWCGVISSDLCRAVVGLSSDAQFEQGAKDEVLSIAIQNGFSVEGLN